LSGNSHELTANDFSPSSRRNNAGSQARRDLLHSSASTNFWAGLLSGQHLALIGSFERLAHRFVEIVDKRENFVFQRIFRKEIASLDHLCHQNTKPDFDLIHP
jgi:hypothetical protein